jgi:hypothetical protein
MPLLKQMGRGQGLMLAGHIKTNYFKHQDMSLFANCEYGVNA